MISLSNLYPITFWVYKWYENQIACHQTISIWSRYLFDPYASNVPTRRTQMNICYFRNSYWTYTERSAPTKMNFPFQIFQVLKKMESFVEHFQDFKTDTFDKLNKLEIFLQISNESTERSSEVLQYICHSMQYILNARLKVCKKKILSCDWLFP